MSYLALLINVRANGVEALGALGPTPGLSLPHPWQGLKVDSPRGLGRLIWTDGFRAVVEPRKNLCWFVDLDEIRLPDE